MIKTYREVLRDIKPGETWECIENSIIKAVRCYKDKSIEMEYTTFSQSGIFCVSADKEFKLKKDEVEFEDAIKALKEGKIIESCETSRLCRIDKCFIDKKIILVRSSNSSTWLDLNTIFKPEEVLGKWYIYNEGEI